MDYEEEDLGAFLEEENALYAAFSKNWVGGERGKPARQLAGQRPGVSDGSPRHERRPELAARKERRSKAHHDAPPRAPKHERHAASPPPLRPQSPATSPKKEPEHKPVKPVSLPAGPSEPSPKERTHAPADSATPAAPAAPKPKRDAGKQNGFDTVNMQMKALLYDLKGKMASGELDGGTVGRRPAPRDPPAPPAPPAPAPAPPPKREPAPPRSPQIDLSASASGALVIEQDVPFSSGHSDTDEGAASAGAGVCAGEASDAPAAEGAVAEPATVATQVGKQRKRARQKRQGSRNAAVQEAHGSVYRGKEKEWLKENLDAKAVYEAWLREAERRARPDSRSPSKCRPREKDKEGDADRTRRMQEWQERIDRQLALEKQKRAEREAEDQRRAQQKVERQEESAKKFAEWKAKKDAEKEREEKEKEATKKKEREEKNPFASGPSGPVEIVEAAARAAEESVRRREEREKPWRFPAKSHSAKHRHREEVVPPADPAGHPPAPGDLDISLRRIEGEVSAAIAAAAVEAAAADEARERESKRRTGLKPAPSFDEWKKEKRRREKEAERRREEALKRFGIGPYARPKEPEPAPAAASPEPPPPAIEDRSESPVRDEGSTQAEDRAALYEELFGCRTCGHQRSEWCSCENVVDGTSAALDRVAMRAWRESLQAAVGEIHDREVGRVVRRSMHLPAPSGGWEGSVAGGRAREDRRTGLDREYVATSRAYVRMHNQARFPVQAGETVQAREALDAEKRVRAEARRRRQRAAEARRAQEKAETFERHLAAKQAGSATMQAFMRGRTREVAGAEAVHQDRRLEENLYLIQDMESRVDRAVARASVAGHTGEVAIPAGEVLKDASFFLTKDGRLTIGPTPGVQIPVGTGARSPSPPPRPRAASPPRRPMSPQRGAMLWGHARPTHQGPQIAQRGPEPAYRDEPLLAITAGPAPTAERERQALLLAAAAGAAAAAREKQEGQEAPAAAPAGKPRPASARAPAASPAVPAKPRPASAKAAPSSPWLDDDDEENEEEEEKKESPVRRPRPHSAKPNAAHPGRPWSAGWRSATAERAELGIVEDDGEESPLASLASSRTELGPPPAPAPVAPAARPSPAVAWGPEPSAEPKTVEATLDELIARREAVRRRLQAAGL